MNELEDNSGSTAWYSLPPKTIFERLNTSELGLTEDEVQHRLEKYGPNSLQEIPPYPVWKLFIDQFNNYLIIILLFAVLLSAFVGEIIDAFVILVIVIFAAGLGFVLMEMTAPTAKVIRNSKQLTIPTENLVPGDIIPIMTGDKIPADARLFESFNLQTDESSLTGESVSVDKNANVCIQYQTEIGNRVTMVHAGTITTYGRGVGIVVATGMQSEFGTIAGLLSSIETSQTPLQRNLDQMGKTLAKIVFAVIFIVFGVGVYVRGFDPLDMFVWAIALAIAVVPEALPAVVTISLAIGVQKMSKRHALIRKLPAVETLGSTSVICSDKTGTLTKGEMEVSKFFVSGYEIDIKTIDPDNLLLTNKETNLLFLGATLCNDTKIEMNSTGLKYIGSPTETALKSFATTMGCSNDSEVNFPRIDEIPFTSERKMMSTVHKSFRLTLVFCKGAPEFVLQHCNRVMEKNTIYSLSAENFEKLQKITEGMAQNSLRTIAIAFKEVNENYSKDDIEKDLIFLGFIGLRDPPREGVREAVEECRKAGIKTVMITGDHLTTAVSIAKEINIVERGSTLTGLEIDSLTDTELDKCINDIEVFARVAPAHKLRVVESLSRAGHIVAMTGDGINDAPALKRADVGIAMGIKGTDVTKESSNMILTDDNFVSIVGAIEEGRIMFSNIKKYLMYLLSSNLGEILILGLSVLLGLPLPLIAIQILYVNLATDGLPALALAVDPPEGDYMFRPPRNPHRSIFSRSVVFLMVIGGIWSATVNLSIFLYMTEIVKVPLAEAQSIVFASLIIIQFFKAFNYRSDHLSFTKYGIFSNKWLNLAILWEFTLLLFILYVPFLQIAFGTFSLGILEWILVMGSAVSIIPVLEFGKVFVRKQLALEIP